MVEIQCDHKVRIVALQNLKAMCERVSGSYCHRFAVSKVTAHSVHVTYSNENEHAVARPFVMVFQAYVESKNVYVILEFGRTIHETSDHGGEGYQCFHPLVDCPVLWRSQDGDWRTEEEIKKEQAATAAGSPA